MITAKEYFIEQMSGKPLTQDWVIEHLIEFAKLHVWAALETVSENINIIGDSDWVMQPPVINKDNIFKSYPLTNIK